MTAETSNSVDVTQITANTTTEAMMALIDVALVFLLAVVFGLAMSAQLMRGL
jgi:hypothetical protein